MIINMPAVAAIAMNAFTQIDRPKRKIHHYVKLLEPLPVLSDMMDSKTKLEAKARGEIINQQSSNSTR